MGTLPSRIPVDLDPPLRSFCDALVSHTLSSSQNAPVMNSTAIQDLGKLSTHKGAPAIYHNHNQVTRYSDLYHQTLVAKFSQGYNKQNPNLSYPSLEKFHEFLVVLDLHNEVQLGLLDNRHVLVRCAQQRYYLQIYSRSFWFVRGLPMRIFKWSTGFHIDKESPIVLVWITFPPLPIQFF